MDRPNRSPSLLSIRQNPNLRNSESRSDVRRSFTGSPFGDRPPTLTNLRFPNSNTPANSPADHLRRHSLGKEGAGVNSRVHDEKENEKAAQVRSAVKGSKNFMSPTISAASKFTPSPRKKVLAERNEIVRTSIQFSDSQGPVLMKNSCLKPEKMLDHVKTEGSLDSKVDQKEVIAEVHSVPQVNLDSKITENSDCVRCTKKKTVSFSEISTIIAPLDADPSQSPYDPNTNFLSPRPQFLHYKPNPRIEDFLNKDIGFEYGECDVRLEDSFIMSGESESEDSLKESESENSPKASEDLSSSETIYDKEEEPIDSEQIPISTPTLEPALEAKISSKPRFFTKAKFISLLLVFLIACGSIYVTNSPILDSSVLKDVSLSTLYDSSDVAAFATSNLYELAKSFRQLPVDSISYYFSGLFTHFSQPNEFGPIQFVNLTSFPPQGDLLVDQYIGVDFDVDDELEETQEEGEWEMVSKEYDVDEVESGTSVEDQPVQEPQVTEIIEEIESVDVKQEVEMPEFQSEHEVSDVRPDFVASDLASHAVNDPIVEVTKVELSSEFAPSEPLPSTVEDTKAELSSEISPSELEPKPSTLNATAYKFFHQNMLGVSLLVFSIAAATIFTSLRQRKCSASSAVAQELPKKPIVSKQVVSHNWEAEVDADAESSCPSEMSSLQKSSSYTQSTLRAETNEAQSHEKRQRTNYKRESLASSSDFSMGSLSYGSFTTYERIPIKKASGEEEIVTPVRRSSRIRSHVTSP